MGASNSKLPEHESHTPEEENVYNPKKDLYPSRPSQQYPTQTQQQQDKYQQEVYSPTQDVQDMYSKPRKPIHPMDSGVHGLGEIQVNSTIPMITSMEDPIIKIALMATQV